MKENNNDLIIPHKEKQHVFETNKKYFTISVYALFVIAIGAILVFMIMNWNATRANISYLFGVLSPFWIAFFISYLLLPLVRRLDRLFDQKLFRGKAPFARKSLAIFTSYAITLGLVAIFFTYVIPQIATSITDLSKLSDKTVAIYENLYSFVENLSEKYPNLDFSSLEEGMKELSPQFLSFGTNFLTNVVPLLFSFSVNVVKLVINILLSVVISCYMLFDEASLKKNGKRVIFALIPKKKADHLLKTLQECNSIFSGFIIGKFIDSLIIGILCFILMSIFRFPYAILLSVIVGVTNMIPYFGPFIGAVPGVILYLLINPIQAVFFAIMILCLQQFDGLYLGPKILGESTGLKPLWVIFAITVGGAYFGVLGMFLGVPVIAVFSYLLDTFIGKKLKERNISDLS